MNNMYDVFEGVEMKQLIDDYSIDEFMSEFEYVKHEPNTDGDFEEFEDGEEWEELEDDFDESEDDEFEIEELDF